MITFLLWIRIQPTVLTYLYIFDTLKNLNNIMKVIFPSFFLLKVNFSLLRTTTI